MADAAEEQVGVELAEDVGVAERLEPHAEDPKRLSLRRNSMPS